MQYLELALPKKAFFFHAANGGWRSAAEGGVFKALGVKAGFPDLCIFFERRAYCLEVKRPGGTLRTNQRARHAEIQDAGVPVETVKSVEDARRALATFGIPIKDVRLSA